MYFHFSSFAVDGPVFFPRWLANLLVSFERPLEWSKTPCRLWQGRIHVKFILAFCRWIAMLRLKAMKLVSHPFWRQREPNYLSVQCLFLGKAGWLLWRYLMGIPAGSNCFNTTYLFQRKKHRPSNTTKWSFSTHPPRGFLQFYR